MKSRLKLTDRQLEERILSETSTSWKKVAMVIAVATQGLGREYEERSLKRILALIDAGRLEIVGEVDEPRYSEIRLSKPREGGG